MNTSVQPSLQGLKWPAVIYDIEAKKGQAWHEACCTRASHPSQAVKRLQETLAWRAANDVERASCSACITDPRSHYMHPVGFDRYGRPVLYSCLQLAANRSVEDNRRHMVATFEQVCPG